MSGFDRDPEGRARLGGASVDELMAQAGIPTPAYLYDLDGIRTAAREMITALDDPRSLVAYAVKANSAASVIRAVAEVGGGAEVVSQGELEVALGAGVPEGRIMTTSVAKTDAELDRALAAGIRAIQMESAEELPRVAARARTAGVVARISLRINPGVSVDTHAHVATGHDDAKFGIHLSALGEVWQAVDRMPELSVVGVSAHVGSTLREVDAYLASARVVCDVARARRASGKQLEFVDFGGGFGIDYGGKPVPPPRDFLAAARRLKSECGLGDLGLVVEPGRSMVAPYGVLVATVIQEKRTPGARWVFLDAAMNDLIRPALYGARHRIEPTDRPPSEPLSRVAGPVCESADDFGEHPLGPAAPRRVVFRDAGAYGFVMASEYNGRALPAEVFVSGGRVVSVSQSPGRDAWVARRLGA